MFLVSACICLCVIYWSQVLSGEWRCSWSSADRRCSNYIWVINNLIAYYSATYIRDLTVGQHWLIKPLPEPILSEQCGWGLGGFLRWWPPSTMWAGPLIYLWPPPGKSEKSHLFQLGLYSACWARFMCHHDLWPTSVTHPFSLDSSLGFAGGKHYQKITIPIFRLGLQNFAIPGCFPYILFYRNPFSLLSSGWFVVAVCGSISVQGTT